LNRIVRLADAAGWQVIIQATGDLAVRMALNAHAHAVRSNRAPARGRRHRIERIGLVDPEDLPRFGPLNVIASMQPLFALPAPGDVDVLADTLGEARAGRVFPVVDVAPATRLILGSGWPLRPLNPLLVIDAVVNPAPEEPGEGGTAARPRGLPVKAAIDAYTSSAAWASFDDQRKGALSAGMLADLVVLSEDVFADPAKLASTSVAVTIFDGKVVYSRTPRSQTEPAPSPQH
jgi:predicted amidohydrolase YtcJ